MVNPLISIYITSHNYEKFIKSAIDSALSQTYENIEIIIFDDNSSDGSPKIIERYCDFENIQCIFSKEKNGLRKASNECIKVSKGDYVMRLDADDLLNENCIQIMVNNLEKSEVKPKFIFSNYFYINDEDDVLGAELIHRVKGSYKAVSLPPHGACCLVKKTIFDRYGLYDESIERQDGHELWITIVKNDVPFIHLELPLWYYRKHGDSLSSDNNLVYKDRKILKQNLNKNSDLAIAFIPVLRSIFDIFDPIKTGHLDRLVNEIRSSNKFKSIFISSDSYELKTYCDEHLLNFHDRSELLLSGNVEILGSLEELITKKSLENEIFCVINLTSVNVNRSHLQEVINTLQLYNSDSIISVYPDNGIMYKMSEFGLSPINYDTQFKIRKDRDYVYIFNGALRVFRGSKIIMGSPFGEKIGHIEMSANDSELLKTSDQAIRYFQG